MFTTSVCAFLLASLAVSVHSYSLRLLDTPCPRDADVKLDKCLTTLERIARLELLAENCRPAMEAMRCTKMLMTACMNSEDTGVLKVLSSHDLSVVFKIKPARICLGQ